MDFRVVCTNIAIPTDVLIINELKHVKFDTGMKLGNIIWIIFAMPTFDTVGTDGSMMYEKNNIYYLSEM